MEYVNFLEKCLTPHHTIRHVIEILRAQKFKQWSFGDSLAPGNYYFTFQTLLVAFKVPVSSSGFRIVGTHSDSPVLKLKPRPLSKINNISMVALRPYGGGLWHTWFDRDMGLAGIVVGNEDRLVTIHEPVIYIPSLAIHSAHDIYKEGFQYNKEEHLKGILQWNGLEELLSASHDLSLFDLKKPTMTPELVYSARQDNLHSTYCALEALLRTQGSHISVLSIFDNKEIGSQTISGAQSTLFVDLLEAICQNLEIDFRQTKSNSFFLSVDVAHATHPNYTERFEKNHPIYLKGGPVIKHGTRYATNVYSVAYVKRLAEGAGVPIQEMVLKNGVVSGGTIGPMVAVKTGIATCDIGAPLLGMHSVREVTALEDLRCMTNLLSAFYDN